MAGPGPVSELAIDLIDQLIQRSFQKFWGMFQKLEFRSRSFERLEFQKLEFQKLEFQELEFQKFEFQKRCFRRGVSEEVFQKRSFRRVVSEVGVSEVQEFQKFRSFRSRSNISNTYMQNRNIIGTMKASQITYLIQNFPQFVEVTPQLKYALATIVFNPVFWNIVARLQHKTHFLSKAVGGPYRGCYLLAFTIFSLGIYRDHVYHQALEAQPTYLPLLTSDVVRYAAYAIFAFGNVLVLSSMWALGVTGTYLGDYFGILMKERVTSFPFNINDNPMYNGSTLCFLGTALYYGKPTGILVSAFVFIMYRIALLFEEPYTARIYAGAANKSQ